MNPQFYIIIEYSLQHQLGIDILNLERHFLWDDIYIPMVPPEYWQNKNEVFKQTQEYQSIEHEQMLLETNYQPKNLSQLSKQRQNF